MPKLSKTASAPYSQQQIYDLVVDVAAYPQFLPFCTKTTLHESSDTHMIADMHIGYKGFTGSFQSHVSMKSPTLLRMKQSHGALKYLDSQWEFIHQTTTSCGVNFSIDFEAKSWVMGKLINPILDEMANIMLQSFLNRAKVIYGHAH
jgi:coenzyme Q-binding protein COQ10